MKTFFMSSRNNQHVIPFGNGWAVQKEGRKHVYEFCSKQSWAIEIAKENAMKHGAEVIIYTRDERVRSRKRYPKQAYTAKII